MGRYNSTKRFYSADKRSVDHFRARCYRWWYENPGNKLFAVWVLSGFAITLYFGPRKELIAVLVLSYFAVTLYFGHLETVPYTKRTHFVILSNDDEKQLGENDFKQVKNQFKGKILPPLHPQSLRERNIAQDIIHALERGLRKEQVWNDVRYSEESASLPFEASHASKTAVALSDDKQDEWISDDKWREEEESLDDKWVQQSRLKGLEKGVVSKTSHLEGLEWEVIVVDEPIVEASCLPGGKIVVFTGLLKHLGGDAEVATIVGHEVAHAVARHTAEQASFFLALMPWMDILQVILYPFVSPDIVKKAFQKRLILPFRRRMEMEADYIGLMLMASAGYDPRVAPQVCEMFVEEAVGDSASQDDLATYPSGRERAQVLAQAKVMEEAMDLYREVQHRRKGDA